MLVFSLSLECFNLTWTEIWMSLLHCPHFLPTHVFFYIGFKRSHDASHLKFRVSITNVQFECQPKARPLKFIIISINDLLCDRASPRVRQKIVMRLSRHRNLGSDKLWLSKFLYVTIIYGIPPPKFPSRCCGNAWKMPSQSLLAPISKERHFLTKFHIGQMEVHKYKQIHS